ncbi:hypothetical protein ATKI12_0827 [Kitasatospora sp. Ki12]
MVDAGAGRLLNLRTCTPSSPWSPATTSTSVGCGPRRVAADPTAALRPALIPLGPLPRGVLPRYAPPRAGTAVRI